MIEGDLVMKNNILKAVFLASAAALTGALAGCATGIEDRTARAGDYVTDDPRYGPGDRVFKGGQVDTVFHHDRTLEESREIWRASYSGVAGARLAHELYRGQQAEALDGDCEARVVANAGETLWDIADFCDVSVFELGDFNPGLGPTKLVSAGDILSIPHTGVFDLDGLRNGQGVDSLPLNPLGGPLNAISATKVKAYRVQPGDTLSEIAQRHSVSAATIANINPGTDWRALPIGALVSIPVVNAAAKKQPVGAKAPGVHTSASLAPILEVDKRAARVGERIKIAAAGLPPSTEVRLYRGLNRREMDYIGAFVTNAAGELYADARAVKTPHKGGLIFAAAVDGGDTVFSRRVNGLGE